MMKKLVMKAKTTLVPLILRNIETVIALTFLLWLRRIVENMFY